MKNAKRYILFSMFAIFILAFSMTASAASTSDIAKKQYRSFLSKNNIGGHAIVDIDANGIPELIYFNNSTWKNVVMTYDKSAKKMKVLCSMASGKGYGCYYSYKNRQVALSTGSTGGSTWKIYKISGTRATLSVTYTCKHGGIGSKWVCTKNGKSISSTTFTNAINAYYKWHYVKGIF